MSNIQELVVPASSIVINTATNDDYLSRIPAALEYLGEEDISTFTIVRTDAIAENRAIVITKDRVAHTLDFKGELDEILPEVN